MNAWSLISLGLTQLWQLSVAILLIVPIAWWLCRRRPHWAYALLLLVLIKCVTPPLWSSPTSMFSWLGSEQIVRSSAAAVNAPSPATDTMPAEVTPVTISDQPAPASATLQPIVAKAQPGTAPVSLAAVVLGLWAAGALSIFSIVAGMSWAMLSRIERSSQKPTVELAKLFAELQATVAVGNSARLVVSSAHFGPALVGLIRPRIVLPALLIEGTPTAELTPIVAHELVHLRRGDHWIAHLQLLAQSIWWFHPLVWWANRELNRAREMSCDEEVLATLDCDPARYAQTLLDVVRLRRQLRPMPLALSMRPAQFAAMRLNHIMNQSLRFHRRTPWACWVAIALAAMVLLPGAGLLASGDKNAKGETITRVVLDGDTQKPIAGVRVKVDHEISTPAGQKIIATTEHVTDTEGEYEIKIPAAELDEPTLGLRFHIDQPGYAPGANIFYGVQYFRRATAHGMKFPFDVDRLYPGEEVSGVVEDPDGKPVADLPAHVASTRGQPAQGISTSDPDDDGVTTGFVTWGSQPVSSQALVRTDAQGRFRFRALKGGNAQIWVEPKGYAALTHSIGKKRGDVGKIVLERGVGVVGRVVDTDDHPVANVWVNLSLAGRHKFLEAGSDLTSRSAKTDREGNFRTEPLHPGSYVARVSAHDPSNFNGIAGGDTPAVFEPAKAEVPADKTEARLEIKAIPHYTITAHVTDSSGEPFAGARLAINAQRGGKNYSRVFESDFQGLVEAHVPRDLHSARVSPLGPDPQNVYRQRLGKEGQIFNYTTANLDRLEGDFDNLYYVHYRPASLWFTVVDTEGKRILDATAKINYLDHDGKFDRLSADTEVFPIGDQGDWNTIGLLPGQQFLLTVDAPGHQPQSYKFQLAEGESQDLKVVLKQ
jgi:beta-lactamase regulating signal transducer with metallopeptidase domain